jgi:hypothetical protein
MGTGRTDYWRFFSDDARRTGSILYSKLAAGIGADTELRNLAARARDGQPHANLILGAVHFLLLRGAEGHVKRFYPSVGGSVSAESEDPFPDFRAFVLEHLDAIAPLITARVTNTNEIGRSALLHPGFRRIAAEAAVPLSLIEIGPSAGLNLIWDKYGVRYRKDGVTVAAVNENAPLVIDCELRGDRVPPTGPTPVVGGRVGLELNPVNLADADDRDWLRALIWPDQVQRLRRLERAIELFAQDKPAIRPGDALALLPGALAAVPSGQIPVVYHTIAVYQFSRGMREALESILTIVGLRRPLWRLAFEFDAFNRDDGRGGIGDAYILSMIRYADGVREERRLASAHPHGTWLEWLA